MSLRALASALLAGLVLACRTAPAVWSPLPTSDPWAGRLLEAQEARDTDRRALRARARVSVEGEGSGSFAKELLLLERPARLRVEVLGLLGQRVAVLASDGEDYALWRAETKQLERGEVHPGILAEVAGVPLRPEEAVALLLGTPSLPAEPPRASRADALGATRLAWSDGPWRRVAEFDAEGRLRAWRIAHEDEAWLEVRWDDFRDVAGQAFAYRVDLDFPAAERRAEVDFHEVELNPRLAPGLFRLEIPARVSRREPRS